MSSEQGVRVELLGPSRLYVAGHEVAVSGARRRALLARLSAARQPLGAERLVDDLWDGDPPPAAAHTLQSHVSALRKLLPDNTLVFVNGSYQLLASSSDVADFEGFVRRARELAATDPESAAVAYTDAESVWRGDAIADADGAQWARSEATRLEELRTMALEEHLELLVASGRAADAVGRAEVAIGHHPLRERLWRTLMTALAVTGRTADALRAYQRVRTMLGEELGLEPSAETQALERRIAVGEVIAPAPGPPATASVSAAPSVVSSRLVRAAARPFVGRRTELAAIVEALDEPVSAAAIVVSGPAGIGKTTLIARAVDGRPVVAAECFREGGLPLQPLADIAAALGHELPLADGVIVDPQIAEFTRIRAIERAVASAVGPAGLVVVLDDLQWADAATLGCLRHLLGASLGVRLVASLRTSEVHITGAVDEFVADVRRGSIAPSSLRIELDGLPPGDVGELVRQYRPEHAASASDDVQTIVQRTGGNPLFVIEYARSPDGPDAVPRSLQDLVGAQLHRLPADTRGAVSTAAALGNEFDLHLLARVLGVDLESTLEQIEPAVAAALIDESGEWRFAFRHGLVRDAVLAGVLDSRRRLLHRRIASAGADALDPLELARHWTIGRQPGDEVVALRSFVAAGRIELRSGAATTGLGWFERAAALVDHGLPDSEISPAEAFAVRVGVAHARWLNGAADARSDLHDLATAALDRGWNELAAEALLHAGRGFSSNLMLPDPNRRALVQAVLETWPSDAYRARLLVELATETPNWQEADDCAALADAAVEVARRTEDREVLAYAIVVGASMAVPSRFGVADHLLGELSVDDVPEGLHGMLFLQRLMAALRRGDGEEVRRHEAALWSIPPGRLGVIDWIAAIARARRAALEGRWDDAERLSNVALETGLSAGQRDAKFVHRHHLWSIRWQQGRLGEMLDTLRRGLSHGAPPDSLATLAVAELASGDRRVAACLLEEAHTSGFPTAGISALRLPLLALWASVAHDLVPDDGITDATLGNVRYWLADQLLPFADVVIEATPNVYGAGAYFAALAAANHDPSGAARLLTTASEIHRRLGCEWLIANADAARGALAGAV